MTAGIRARLTPAISPGSWAGIVQATASGWAPLDDAQPNSRTHHDISSRRPERSVHDKNVHEYLPYLGRHHGLTQARTQGFVKHPFQICRIIRLFQHQTRCCRSAISCDENDGSAASAYRFGHGVHALAAVIDVEKCHIELRSSRYLQSVVESSSRPGDHLISKLNIRSPKSAKNSERSRCPLS